MKVLVVPFSLHSVPWKDAAYWIASIKETDTVVFLNHFDRYCEAAGLSKNLAQLHSLLNAKGLTVETSESASLDSYLLKHSNEEFCITPAGDALTIVVQAAVVGGFDGNLWMLGTKNEPPRRSLMPQIRGTRKNPKTGIKSLNKAAAVAKTGSECSYTIDGRKYLQRLFRSENCGAEGYIIDAVAPGYCLKIWNAIIPRAKYFNEKIRAMLSVSEPHPDIAIPKAFVFNETGEAIGVCMPKYEGESLCMSDLSRYKKAKKLSADVIFQIIWLEAHGFVHRDVWHNLIVSSDNKAHIIDLDSVQFGAYPATALSADVVNYLPDRFFVGGAFHNTIDTSYTVLMMLLRLYLSADKVNELLWDSDNACPTVNNSILNTLPDKLREFVVRAYENEQPVSLVEQLLFAETEALHSSAEYIMEDLYRAHSESRRENNEASDDMMPAESSSHISQTSEIIYSPEYPTHKTNARSDTAQKQKPWFVRLLQQLILKLFFSQMGTIPADCGQNADLWKVFVRSGKWKKPLATAVICVILIIFMFITLVSI